MYLISHCFFIFFRRFAKLRHERIATGLQDPLVSVVSTPPVESTSGEDGGVQSGPHRTSTPGKSLLFSSYDDIETN